METLLLHLSKFVKNTYFDVILKPLTFKRSIHFVLTSLLTSHFDFSHFLNSQLNDNRDSQNLSSPKIKTINAWYENAAHYFSSTFIWLTRLVFNFTDNVLRFMVVKILEVCCLPETSVNKLTSTYIAISYVTKLKHVTCALIANTKNSLKFTTTCKII